MRESERQIEAFKYYVSLGWKRSYARVARDFNVHLRTVERWGRTFNWVQRAATLAQRDASAADGLDVKRIVRAALATFVDWLDQKQQEGQPACASVGELEKLVKLDLLLSGSEDGDLEKKEIILRFRPDMRQPSQQEARTSQEDPTQ